MTDWRSSMQQSFEYYKVDAASWKDTERIEDVESCSITRDLTSDTLGSATLKMREFIPETYIRVYLVTVQGGVTERYSLGTFLAQTPSSSFDGKTSNVTVDAYTPLIELKENQPPIGYYVPKNSNVMQEVYTLTQAYSRAPIVEATSEELVQEDFVANTNDTWISFLSDLAALAKFYYNLDDMGRIIFEPVVQTAALQPTWEYNDSNSSILQPDVTLDHDIYGIPNVVEVIYTTDTYEFSSRAVNDDPSSMVSTVNRGREITERVSNPNFSGTPTQELVDEYAKQYLKEVSTLEYTISYKHGYCPVRVGDGVLLNYERYGLENVKAKVTSQKIDCSNGCQVTETATFSRKFWEG